MSAEVAAATLDLHAHMELPKEDFPGLASDLVGKLNTMLYFTRAAIIIQWMRLVITSSGDAKWRNILERFEIVTFPTDPVAGVEVVRYVNDLIALTTRSQAFASKTNITDPDLHVKMRQWWEEWLSPISPDKAVIDSIGNKFGLLLLFHITDETKALGEIVQKTCAETHG